MRVRSLSYACALLWAGLAAPRAHALLTFPHRDNDGADQVIVTGTYTIGYDTNVFAQRVKQGALTQSLSCGATYTRRAGLIGVEADFTMNAGAFAGLSGQDFADPSFALNFNKGTGRTTGSLDFSAAKSNAPDPVANNRAVAWNYSAALALRYPLIDRYYFTNTTTYAGTSYENRQLFTNQNSYSDAFLVNIIYDSKLTLDTGYHIALDTTHDTTDVAQSYTVGAQGTILPKLTGSFDVGYAWDESSATHQPSVDYHSMDADAAMIWRFSRTLSFNASVTKAFGISSTDVVTDTTSATIAASGNIGKRFRSDIGLTYVGTDFISPNGLGRKDTLWEVPVDLGTAITTHIRLNLNYTWMENYSNLSSAKFVRETLSLSIIATY